MTTSLFDIAADLDTPVSAFAQAGPFQPRFLLESVEGGERLARYSFIGFGDCLEVRLDAPGLTVGGAQLPRAGDQAELLAALREALAAAPRPQPEMPGLPLAGGLVGFTRLRRGALLRAAAIAGARADDGCPTLHYVAPRVAAGVRSPDARHRAAARRHRGRAPGAAPRSHPRAARRPAAAPARAASFSAPDASRCRARTTWRACARTQEYIAAGDVYQLVLSVALRGHACDLDPFEVYRALRLHQSFALHVLLRARRPSPWSARRPRRW